MAVAMAKPAISTRASSFADRMLQEFAAAGPSACGFSSQEYGSYVCLRAPHDMTQPHVGRLDDTSLIQWIVDQGTPPDTLGGA